MATSAFPGLGATVPQHTLCSSQAKLLLRPKKILHFPWLSLSSSHPTRPLRISLNCYLTQAALPVTLFVSNFSLSSIPVALNFIFLRKVATFSFDYSNLYDSSLCYRCVNSFGIGTESCVSPSAFI